MNLRVEIAEIIATGRVRRKDCSCAVWRWGMSGTCPDCTAKNILTLISEDIEKCLLTDVEMISAVEQAPKPCPMEFRDEPRIRAAVQAQLQKILALLGSKEQEEDGSY